MALSKQYTAYAALDIGTSASGYAFSLAGNSAIHINQAWESGNGSVCTAKTPTCVLLNPKGELHAFGYEAENKYTDLADEGQNEDWWCFRRFKMQLYDVVNVKRGLSVTDETGKTKKALDVFALCIHYLKDHLIKQLQSRLGHITLDDVYWVITIPAIWNEPAKRL
ncbi:hypothetical protein ScPMuIL_014028 [Solemya velum]